MATWTIYEPPGLPTGSAQAADKAVLVRDGFCLPALLIPHIWLLWRRMWLPFLLFLALTLALGLMIVALDLPETVAGLLQALLTLAFALEANALRGWSLTRKGWRCVGVACAANESEAEIRYLAGVRVTPVTRLAAPMSGAREIIADLFPEPGGARL